MILAGIVLYNPDIRRLKENISSIRYQVDKIVFIDNSTIKKNETIECVENLLDKDKFVFIDNDGNVGIARALNQIMGFAASNGFEWVLTLDQDTVCPCDLLKNYEQFLNRTDIGIICPKIKDRNFDFVNGDKGITEYVDSCITSAALTSTKIWKSVGGFTDDLFIDYVDFDYCLKLKEHEYKILRVNTVSILHEIGHAKTYNILGKRILLFNHPPIRTYYIVRNKLFCADKYRSILNSRREKKEVITFVIKTLLFEDNKREKMLSAIRGIRDGKRMIAKLEGRGKC